MYEHDLFDLSLFISGFLKIASELFLNILFYVMPLFGYISPRSSDLCTIMLYERIGFSPVFEFTLLIPLGVFPSVLYILPKGKVLWFFKNAQAV